MQVAKSYHFIPALIILTLLVGISCSAGAIGYGVLLWAPEDVPLNAASVVKVLSESSLEEIYIIQDEETGSKYSVPRWRVEFYDNEEAAIKAASGYSEFSDSMALSKEVGLPVRAEADALSDRVYRLRQNEEIKVLSRSDAEVKVGAYNGYWYKILTMDGTVGYCFDHYLIIYASGDRDQILAKRDKDPRIENFLTTSYYPERFQHLINQGTIDLDIVKPEYGLFPDTENRTILINSPRYRLESPYGEISEAGNNRYLFEDTTLYVTFQDLTPPVNSVIVQFKVDSTDITGRYVAIPELEEYLTKEAERRDEALKSLIQKGRNFSSSAYGTLRIEETGQFEWTGNDRLIPSVLKSHFGHKGLIRFDRFPAASLRGEYDGAATFRFYGAARTEAVTFLFSLEPQGLRLTLVTEENISDFTVQEVGYNSLVLFMSRQE